MKKNLNSLTVASGFARLAVCALLSLAGVWSAWGGIGSAPINPAFKEWQRKRNLNGDSAVTNAVAKGGRLLSAPSEAEAYPLGYVPGTIDYSYLRDINYQNVYQAGSSALPSRFDLRDNQMVTPVKNQGSFGTCWSHATMGALESVLLMKGEGAFDFSEKHLANTHGWDYSFANGGNGTMATAYLTRWSGPIAESEDPYPTSSYVPSSPEGTPLGHVQNVKILAPMSDASDTAEIKKTVMEHGGVYVGYYHVWNALSANGRNFYWNGNESLIEYGDGGHAVLIVGWDDDYSKSNFKATPPGNGAFIVKNSWGTGFGDNGYFYVSYYDATFGREELFSFVNLESVDNYARVYQYDPLGHVANCGGRETCWGANMFTAAASESLAAVGFYANVPNTKYEISVYTGCSAGKPMSGTRKTVQSGTCDFSGYVTVPLDTDVSVTQGSRFSVVVKLTTPQYLYPIAYEAYFSYTYNKKTYWTPTSGAEASAGQSFFSQDGSNWWDFTDCIHATANFCCKAYTKSATVVKPTLSSIAITGVSSLTSGESAQFTCEATYSDGSKKSVSPTWSIERSSQNYASVTSAGVVKAKEVTQQQTATVKASYTEDGVTKDDTWSFYVTVAAPDAPTGVTATQGTEASCVRVSWTAPAGATGYAVYRAMANNSNNAQYLENVTVPRYNDTKVTP